MPCGGIYPISRSDALCYQCGRPGADHMLVEWDSMLHGECVEAFMRTDEGETIINHGHWVIVDLNGSGNRRVLRKGTGNPDYYVTEDDITSTDERKA